MSFINALILGIVQGLTEFFPISSSAHLELTKEFLGCSHVPVLFDLSCHLGTLIALIWFFKEEIQRLIKHDRKKIFYLIVALVPLVPGYLLLNPLRKMVSNINLLGVFLVVTGGILILGQKIRFKRKKSLFRDVLMIGAMQSAALIPGISRSASTISCAQILGWTPKEAVRFSFLLAIPTIIGGNIIEVRSLIQKGALSGFLSLHCMVGFLSSLVIGTFIVRFAIRWLEKGKMHLLAWYCISLGILSTLYLYWGK